ncbi:MAG: tripartite tricarboxylate transporter substrate binding protein [Burkholderiales bacterium]|nr:tripartite tricarboxylate transporter substrate binding protein [Burkholderiales bacterium]
MQRAGAQTALSAAAPWPTKPLRILVGFPGGSSPDLTARVLAEPLSRALGQPVIVDNRPGASGNIAADMVAKAKDGHTLGLMINGNLTIARQLNPKTPYDPQKDLAPISLIGTAPLVLVVPASYAGAPHDLVKLGLQAGSTWNYGTPGLGTVAHLGMELFKARTGLSPVHVPYPGNPQVINALLGGQIQLALLPPGLAMTQVQTGRLRAMGVTSSGRSSLVPELPSLAELGLPSLDLEVWNALAAPVGLPAAVRERLATLVSAIVRTPEQRQRLYAQGWQVVGSSPEGLANRMRQDTALLGGVIARQGIRNE